MEENEKSSNTTEKKPNKIKLIDYSKFQHKFNNNNNNNKQTKNNDKKDFMPNNDIIKENNINDIDNKKTNEITKQKNLDQFLNVSGILKDNESQSSLLDNLNANNENNENNEIKSNKMAKDRIDKNIFNYNLDDISIGQNDDQNILTINYNDILINNKENNGILKNFDKNMKNEKDFKTNLNSPNKKKYVKFLTSNFAVTERKKNLDNFDSNAKKNIFPTFEKKKTKCKMNSYVQMLQKNSLFGNTKKHKKNKNNSFNLKYNNKYNNSNTNLSGIINTTSSTIKIDNLRNNNNKLLTKMNNDIQIKNIFFSKGNKQFNKDSNKLLNNKQKTNYPSNTSYNKYFNISDLDLIKNKTKSKKTLVKSNDKINKSALLILSKNKKHKNYNYNINTSINSIKKDQINYNNNNNWNNENKNNDVIVLLDNIKNKYKNEENKYINQQNNMKNEIEILREKLKKMSANEALYQVEIEKLKRNKYKINDNKLNYNKTDKTDNLNIKNNNLNSNENCFEGKLDNIIQKYNNNNSKNIVENISSYSNNLKNNNFNKLLEIFNLDKSIFVGEDIDENDGGAI